jgi:uncharacterized phage protein (TIGR02220 family)
MRTETDLSTAIKTLMTLASDTDANICVNISIKTEKKPEEKFVKECGIVISKLNAITGKNFKLTEANKKFIRARLSEGHSVDDFQVVIRHMQGKWGTSEKYKSYLRPQTLFGTKFDAYLQDAKAKPEDPWEESRNW